jgi:hypothetical protein
MQKYLPFAAATAAIIATQIGCTYYLARETRTTYVDRVEKIAYDGEVIRAGEVVMSKEAALGMLRELAYLFASNDITPNGSL